MKGNGGTLHCLTKLGKERLLGCDEAPDKSTTAGGGFPRKLHSDSSSMLILGL